jgi:hypothetical protein
VTAVSGKPSSYPWLRNGLLYGAGMFVLTIVLFPWYRNEVISWQAILIGLPFWAVVGVAFGLVARWLAKRRK